MDKIYVTGMAFFAYHGFLPEEKRLGQRFFADVVLHLPLRDAGATDDLAKTINYADVYEAVKTIMTAPPVDLIETLAERIAEHLLAAYSTIEKIQVKLHKPSVPIPGILTEVAVEIERTRH